MSTYKPPSELRASYRNYCWTAAGVGTAALAMIAAARHYEVFFPHYHGIFAILAAIVIACGMASCLIASFFPKDVVCFGHKVRTVTEAEIETLCTFAASVLGNVFPTLDDLKKMHSQNPTIYYIIEATNTATNATVTTGCFTVIPLKKGTVEKMEAGGLTGFTLNPTHICKKSSNAVKGLYLGTIIGIDYLSRAAAMKFAKEVIEGYTGKGDITKLFARAITSDGLRILRKYKFKHILTSEQPELNEVCMRICKSSIS